MLVAGGKVIMRMTDRQDSRYVINESETTNIRVCGVGNNNQDVGNNNQDVGNKIGSGGAARSPSV